jgi:hypothetical protein
MHAVASEDEYRRHELELEHIHRYVVETYPDTVVATGFGGTFFSLNPETNWPNFATLTTTNAYEDGANVPAGLYRLNVGVTGKTFDRVLGEAAREGATVDSLAVDTLMPHPVYARQHWLSVITPSEATFEAVLKPLLAEAYGILARRRDAAAAKASG